MPRSKLKTTADFSQWKEGGSNHFPVLSALPCLGDKSLPCLSKVGALGSGCLHLGTMALLLTCFLPIAITVSMGSFCCVGQAVLPLEWEECSNRLLTAEL